MMIITIATNLKVLRCILYIITWYMHIPSSTVDITSGGGIDEEASWCMHEKEVLKNLERTFETNFMKPGHLAFKCKPISEDSRMDFSSSRERRKLTDHLHSLTCYNVMDATWST